MLQMYKETQINHINHQPIYYYFNQLLILLIEANYTNKHIALPLKDT